MEVDGGSINTEQLEETFMKKRVLFSLRVAKVATGQVGSLNLTRNIYMFVFTRSLVKYGFVYIKSATKLTFKFDSR